MPIAPRPFIIKCEHCKWRKYIDMKSDVIIPDLIPSECPICGSLQLKREPATLTELPNRITAWVEQQLKKLGR